MDVLLQMGGVRKGRLKGACLSLQPSPWREWANLGLGPARPLRDSDHPLLSLCALPELLTVSPHPLGSGTHPAFSWKLCYERLTPEHD